MTSGTAGRNPRRGGQPADGDALASPGANGLQSLGLALRGRHVVVGSDAVIDSIRSQSAALVLLAVDAGANLSKKVRDKCAHYEVPLHSVWRREQLGRACGREAVVVLAVTDPGIAANLMRAFGESSGGEAFDKITGV